MDLEDTNPDPVYVGVFGNRGGPRSRTGCHTCRRRKVKCDETRPVCRRCARLSRPCDWSSPRRRRDIPPTSIIASGHGRQACNSPHVEPCTIASDAAVILAASSPLPRFSWAYDIPLYAHTSQSGLCLGPTDHAAILLYRSTFVSLHDTKTPTYSVQSIVFQVGISSALVMHMVLAIGLQYLSASPDSSQRGEDNALCVDAVRHYCEAIRLLGQAIKGSLPRSELNTVLAALWLILVYEQYFGHDTTGQALCKHLQGAASVLEANLPSLVPALHTDNEQPLAADHSIRQAQDLPYLTSRLLVRLTVLDARAASFGLGGQLNLSLARSMGLDHLSQTEVPWSHFLSAIYDHSEPLSQATWGTEYPSTEVAYDDDNQAAFQLYRYCSTLRLMAAQIRRRNGETSSLIPAAKRMLELLQVQFSELFSTAARISPSLKPSNEGLIMTLCWIVPHYYGSVLDFSRIIDMDRPEQQRAEAREQILKLAYYSWENGGATAIARASWPLFMAALTTSDCIHQDWVLSRFEQLSCFGINYRRAHQWLKSRIREMRQGVASEELDLTSSSQISQFFL